MKILKATLIGYKGIYNGMGLTRLDLDLTHSKNNIIMIKGDNGSGKSTLFNALHMFPDPNSNLIEDMACEKRLWYDCNGISYWMKIVHGINKSGRMPTKAYIYKDTPNGKISMNPNGNVTSYIDILESEFLLDQNFLALSQLGVEDRGLVDMRPSERKKFIGSIMKDIDVYNDINKKISQKASLYKNNIQSLVGKLKQLDGETALDAKLNNCNERISNAEADKNDLISKISVLNNKLSAIHVDSTVISRIQSLGEELANLNVSINNIKFTMNKTKSNLKLYDNLDDNIHHILDSVRSDIKSIEKEIQNLEMTTHKQLLDNELVLSKISDKISQIDSLNSDNIDMAYIDELESIRDRLSQLQPKIDKLIVEDISKITSAEYQLGIEAINRISENLSAIHSCSDQHVLEEAVNRVDNNDWIDIDKLNEEVYQLTMSKTTYLSDIHEIERQLDKMDILKIRPSNCKIDTCGFISELANTDWGKLRSRKDKLLEQVDIIDSKISKLKERVEEGTNINLAIVHISNLITHTKNNAHILKKLRVDTSLDKAQSIATAVLNGYTFEEYQQVYSKMNELNIIDVYNDLMIKHDKYLEYEARYTKMNNLITNIEIELDDLHNQSNEIKSNISKNNDTITDLGQDLRIHEILEETLTSYERDLNAYNELRLKHNSIESELNQLNSDNVELADMTKEVNSLNAKLETMSDIIKKLYAEKYDIIHKVKTYDEYKDELSVLKNEYHYIEAIKGATSMSSGIQTVFMSVYMNKILEVANNLLAHLFNGEFELGNFIINTKEFKIPCFGNGIANEDISTMSTSQKCMISLVLSFALLCQSSIKYNILKLDEMDGGLDNTNRSIFVDTLYRLIDLLKAEQVFIISHNNEMNLSECDLIVLRSSDTFHAGNIIFNYNN